MNIGLRDSDNAEHITPAVHRWWHAWETKDLAAIQELALDDYVEFTGHSDSHRVGRATLLSVATRAFERFTIRQWTVIDPVIRHVGNVAVVAYGWRSEVEEGGRARARAGVATDVLVNDRGAWRYLAHHSTETAAGAAD